jgi:hypothetical protein
MALTLIVAALLAAGASGQAPAASSAVTPAPASQPGNKVVCKTTQVTGSLVKKRKACQNKDSWAKQSESHQNQWQEIQGTRGSTNGN